MYMLGNNISFHVSSGDNINDGDLIGIEMGFDFSHGFMS